MPDVYPLQLGDPVHLGPYELTGRLGEGGQGVVYLGRDADGDVVAIKLLRAELSEDAEARGRFVREVAAAKRVARFCTAQVLDADVAGDQPYIVSEYVPGPSLHRLVGSSGPRTGAGLERLAIGTATALVAIHQANVVHRDFKPHNVLIAPDGPRVIDFGIARALDMTATMATHSVGTPAYMAPEQVTGSEITPLTDMFAWGVTMVYAATGIPPFGQDTIPAVINRILTQEPNLGAMPDGPLRLLAQECMSKDPAGRPNASQLLMRLLGQGDAPAAATSGGVSTAVLAEGVTIAATRTPPQGMPPAVVPPGVASEQTPTQVASAGQPPTQLAGQGEPTQVAGPGGMVPGAGFGGPAQGDPTQVAGQGEPTQVAEPYGGHGAGMHGGGLHGGGHGTPPQGMPPVADLLPPVAAPAYEPVRRAWSRDPLVRGLAVALSAGAIVIVALVLVLAANRDKDTGGTQKSPSPAASSSEETSVEPAAPLPATSATSSEPTRETTAPPTSRPPTPTPTLTTSHPTPTLSPPTFPTPARPGSTGRPSLNSGG